MTLDNNKTLTEGFIEYFFITFKKRLEKNDITIKPTPNYKLGNSYHKDDVVIFADKSTDFNFFYFKSLENENTSEINDDTKWEKQGEVEDNVFFIKDIEDVYKNNCINDCSFKKLYFYLKDIKATEDEINYVKGLFICSNLYNIDNDFDGQIMNSESLDGGSYSADYPSALKELKAMGIVGNPFAVEILNRLMCIPWKVAVAHNRESDFLNADIW